MDVKPNVSFPCDIKEHQPQQTIEVGPVSINKDWIHLTQVLQRSNKTDEVLCNQCNEGCLEQRALLKRFLQLVEEIDTEI